MFRRKAKSKTSFLFLHSSNRGSDIVRPENTSMVVNESDTEMDELPRELTSILSEEENFSDTVRKSSFMKSLSQKKQSTPLSQSPRERRVLREDNSQKLKKKVSLTYQKPDSKTEISYFEEVLKHCGATPLPGNGSFLMCEDQAVFSIKLNEKLQQNTENVKKFLNSFEEQSKDSLYLQKMLIHTLTAENCEVARGPVQEPLIRMLLNVSCLQTDLLEILLKEIARVVVENKSESENVQIVASILRQMRFLGPGRDVKLASKLFEIIHVASVNLKREIIFLLPEIISEEEAEETCSQLVDILKFDSVLTHVIIDALTNFPLNDGLRSRVCSKVLNRLDKCSLEHLPSLVQFVLNKSNENELQEVIEGLRKNLPFTPQHLEIRKVENTKRDKQNSEEDSFVKVTFENLKFSLMASKQAAEAWLKVISAADSPADFRCVDLAILVILYNCLFGRKSQILQLLRNKVKAMVLTEVQVQNLFQVLLIIAVEYSSSILELASVFLKSFEGKISHFGALLYKQCFHHFHFYMKQVVISEILLHVGTGSPSAVNAALSVLKELCETEKEALRDHATSVSGLLVKIPDLDLTQVRLLMDVVADLAFSDSSGGSQDELHIFIRKQLISSKLEQCKKGIAAAIMFGKHAGKEYSEEESARFQVNALLEIAIGSSGTSETKRAFFNDEFATTMKESQVKKSFLAVWRKKTLGLILKNLIVKDVEVGNNDFPMSLQYSLGAQEDMFVFPAVDFIIKSEAQTPEVVPISVIPSTLRLMWCLGGESSKFLSVFSASVILPDVAVYESFDEFDEKQKKKILDSLFLCYNYLVECVNAFCVHEYYDRALLRVKQLISVRKLIAKHIPRVLGYLPPFCQFYAPTQKVLIKKKNTEKKQKRGRKRKLDESAAETSVALLAESQKIPATVGSCPAEPAATAERNGAEVDMRMLSGYFREIHWRIYKLLETDLTPLTTNMDDISLEEAALDTSDVLFILEDLTFKTENILKSTEVPFRLKSTASVQNPSADDFIVASIKILPSLLDKLELFSAYSENLLKSNDWIYDAQGLYSEEASDVKLAFAAGLKFSAEILSWRDLQNSNNKLVYDLFSIFSRKKNVRKNPPAESLSCLAFEAARYLAKFGKTILVLSGALSIVKSFQTCLRYASSRSSNELAELCNEFLCKCWYNVKGKPERGSTYNQHVDFLLKTYFASVDDRLEAVRSAAKIALAEIGGLAGSDSELKTFKTINKRNFPLLYRVMCEALVTGSLNAFSVKETDHQRQLSDWNKILETLLTLVEIAKAHSSRSILASLLKRSQAIIQLFLTKGMPIVESALRVKSVEVLSLLKCLQVATRFLHSICCHSRITNDSVVAAHVPAIRSQCERLTLEVKGMLIANQLPLDCITIAILKNRDLKGNDIISQETLEDSDDDDSELPPEDTPDADPLVREDAGDTQESNSEDY